MGIPDVSISLPQHLKLLNGHAWRNGYLHRKVGIRDEEEVCFKHSRVLQCRDFVWQATLSGAVVGRHDP